MFPFFAIETLNNYYEEYPNRKDYTEMVVSKIKLLSVHSQIFLSYTSHMIMYSNYSIDEDVFDSLDDTLVYYKLLTKKQIKEAHKEYGD